MIAFGAALGDVGVEEVETARIALLLGRSPLEEVVDLAPSLEDGLLAHPAGAGRVGGGSPRAVRADLGKGLVA